MNLNMFEKTEKNQEFVLSYFEETKDYVSDLLERLSDKLSYHNREHTLSFVLPSALNISKIKKLSFIDSFIIGIAALFHDTGFLKKYNNNEEIGANFFKKYKKCNNFPYTDNQVKTIINAIKETSLRSSPKTVCSKILRDADLSYIGTKNFKIFFKEIQKFQKESQLYLESPLHKISLEDKLWIKNSLNFLESHTWLTEEANTLYEKYKKENILSLKKHLKLLKLK